MQEGGDRGKGPNKTGTQPRRRATKSPVKTHRQKPKSSAGLVSAGGKHAAQKAGGVRMSTSRQGGPRKIAARTTTRSADKH
jgi:hypothetical protein